jgi:hypothetical protein
MSIIQEEILLNRLNGEKVICLGKSFFLQSAGNPLLYPCKSFPILILSQKFFNRRGRKVSRRDRKGFGCFRLRPRYGNDAGYEWICFASLAMTTMQGMNRVASLRSQ